MKIVKLIICVLFGLMFINAGLNKFFNYMPVGELTEVQKRMFGAFMQITWLMPLVGAAEVVGGILFIPSKTRALGAIVILPVMTGILLHAIVVDPSQLLIVAIMAAINLWMIADNWKKYQPMVR